VSSEAEDAGGLTPGKDDNETGRKADRKDVAVLCEFNYKRHPQNLLAEACQNTDGDGARR